MSRNLKVLFEDNHIIVVLKEKNILSQADISGDPDLLTMTKDYLRVKYNKPGNVFLGLVHRLDRRVAGVMVFAKTSKAASRLSRSIRKRLFKKEYLAIVAGDPPESGELVDYLRKIKKRGKPLAVESIQADNSAKKAILKYNKINSFHFDQSIFSFLKINLITGRYNQIRKQLAIAGYPIINDLKYRYRGPRYGDDFGLFCYKLLFPHPVKDYMVNIIHYPTGWLWGNLKIID